MLSAASNSQKPEAGLDLGSIFLTVENVENQKFFHTFHMEMFYSQFHEFWPYGDQDFPVFCK